MLISNIFYTQASMLETGTEALDTRAILLANIVFDAI